MTTGSAAAKAYSDAADALVIRMLESFEAHPEAAELESVWDMLKVTGFKCDDIGPSLFQASWAFGKAKALFRERRGGSR
jgi:hypothetical protein